MSPSPGINLEGTLPFAAAIQSDARRYGLPSSPLARVARLLRRTRPGRCEDVTRVTAWLSRLTPDDAVNLAQAISTAQREFDTTPAAHAVDPVRVYHTYNAISRLAQLGLREHAEMMYELLLPAAQRSKNTAITAWLHVATALNRLYAEQPSGAERHFAAALELIEGGGKDGGGSAALKFHINALPIYEFFTARALADDGLRYGDGECLDRLDHWSGKLLAFVEHHLHSNAEHAVSGEVLGALQCVIFAQVKIEEGGRTPIPGSKKLTAHLLRTAAKSRSPYHLAWALFQLARVKLREHKIEESFVLCARAIAQLDEETHKRHPDFSRQLTAAAHRLSTLLSGGEADDGELTY